MRCLILLGATVLRAVQILGSGCWQYFDTRRGRAGDDLVRWLMLMALAGALLGQPTRTTMIPGDPPGGYGSACTDTQHAYLTVSGSVYTCQSSVWTIVGGSSGPSITQGTYASLPATCTVNALYFITDSVYTARCSASNTWSLFYQGATLVSLPPSANWTGDNTAAGAGTQSSSQGYLYSTFSNASAVNARFYYRTAPSTPYSVTVLLQHDFTNASELGGLFGFREGSTGKIVAWMFQRSAGTAKAGDAKWTSTSSFSAYYASLDGGGSASFIYSKNPIWFRIRDCGSSSSGACTGLQSKVAFYYSFDGQNFIMFDSQTRTDFMTGGANQYGYGAYVDAGNVNMWIYSLAEGT